MRKTIIFIFCLVLFISRNAFSAEKALDPEHAYNQGVDFYAKHDYNKAADSFLQSMNTQDKHIEHWSAYDLGSAYFAQGQAAEKKDPSAANQIYQKALNFLKQAIELDPNDKDAKYNYELTTKKIIEQKQKEKQQQNRQDKQDKQDKKDQQNSQGKNNNPEQQKQPETKDKQDQQSKQDQQQQDKQEQKNDAGQKPEQNQTQQSAQQNEQHGQMTPEEAKMLLENFQQAEDRKKEVDLKKTQQQSVPGVKDW